MNYFQLFDITPTLNPDQAAVKRKFYELSRKFHPDNFAATDAEGTVEAMKMTATINEAYKTLKNQDATMAYVLKWHGQLEEEEKYTLPPAFLMEMMELNEAVSDHEDDPANDSNRKAAENALAEQLHAWTLAFAPLAGRYNAGETDNAVLLLIKDMYFRKKYLSRIAERMKQINGHAA